MSKCLRTAVAVDPVRLARVLRWWRLEVGVTECRQLLRKRKKNDYVPCWWLNQRGATCDSFGALDVYAQPGGPRTRWVLETPRAECDHRLDESRDLPACQSRGMFVRGVWRRAC